MRIADIVSALGDRPDAVLVGSDETTDLAAQVADALGVPVGPSRSTEPGSVVTLVTADEDLSGAVAEALKRADGLTATDTLLVLLPADIDGIPVAAVLSVAVDHGLELVAVDDLAHPMLGTALRLVAAADPALAAARTELRLERATTRRARSAAAVATRELARRGERIDALRTEVTELRERLATADVIHERAVAARDRELATLRREVDKLQASTSFRIGHALVRLFKEPRLWLRAPARILRWFRS